MDDGRDEDDAYSAEEEDSDGKEDYYYDEEYDAWMYLPRKRVRRRDLTNRKEKIWKLGAKRNWGTVKYTKTMANITIKRDKLDMVTLERFAC
jgi:hypothetical protein